MAILGAREILESTVSVRSREDGELPPMSREAFLERLRHDVEQRR
jgi:threonyl-tRNA synthetase